MSVIATARRTSLTPHWPARLAAVSLATRLHWVLRVSVAGEFIGHGLVGTSRPAAWLPFFRLFGFNNDFARTMMPIIGSWDITIGILVLVLPMRWMLVWTSYWSLFTAFLRPAAGQGWWEFLERGGNYGPPFALLLLSSVGANWRSVRYWFQRVSTRPTLTREKAQQLQWVLRISVAALLIGHGGIGVFDHPGWASYFHLFGIGRSTVQAHSLIPLLGWCEIGLGLAVLIRPFRGLLLFVLVWKVFEEILRPVAGEHVGQFIERFGDYCAPLALIIVLTYLKRLDRAEAPRPVEAAVSAAEPSDATATT
ncbi:MAG TPA: hypothetical protein VH916_00305 [Dehalococcoidia bacterium]